MASVLSGALANSVCASSLALKQQLMHTKDRHDDTVTWRLGDYCADARKCRSLLHSGPFSHDSSRYRIVNASSTLDLSHLRLCVNT